MFALIKDNRVLQFNEEPFPVHPDFLWVDVGEESIPENATYIDGVFGPPEPYESSLIPDTVFQKAVKIMIKNIMLFINGQITKDQLNTRYEAVKNYIEQIV